MAYTTINKSTDYFNTKLYTGNGTTDTAITGVGFQPDLSIIKARDMAYDHNVMDAVRGSTKRVATNLTDAESTQSEMIKSFASDGFNLGNNGGVNQSTKTYVAWNWLAGTTSGLSGGTITPTAYSINTTSGFGIYKYTGNSTAGASIAHGLGKIPKMIIVKRTDSTPNWQIYHQAMGNGKWLEFTTGAQQTGTTRWNDTSPTNTLFYLGTDSDVNSSIGTYIAYVFCDVPGYSKFGSYTGNGNANGPFVYTGFKPAFLIVKRSDGGTENWGISDNQRLNNSGNQDGGNGNYVPHMLATNSSNPESNFGGGSSNEQDYLSNGFKIRSANAYANTSGATYIYMAFASAPLVGSNNVPCTAR